MSGRNLNRRSFLVQVTGSMASLGGALSAVTGMARAQDDLTRSCLTDRDPTDRSGYGRQTGLTDADASDAAGRGTLTSRTDTDAVDLENRGRSWRCDATTGFTDSDTGANADRAGSGRGAGRTGVTDSDSGANADRAGSGRGGVRASAGPDSATPSPAQQGPSGATPPFPRWPPPRASGRLELERARFAGDDTLGEVADRLVEALQRAGNPRASFYTVPGGAALVARLEQIQDDARPVSGADRFVAPRPGEAPKLDDPLDFVSALFFAPAGHYRQVMFVITDRSFAESSWTMTAEDAAGLLAGGSRELSADARALRFSPAHRVTALVYEFLKQGGGEAQVRLPGRWQAYVHMRRSGLLSYLPVN